MEVHKVVVFSKGLWDQHTHHFVGQINMHKEVIARNANEHKAKEEQNKQTQLSPVCGWLTRIGSIDGMFFLFLGK